MKIFMLGEKGATNEFGDTLDAIPKGHEVKIYDPSYPAENQVGEAEVIICVMPISREIIDAAKKVKFIQVISVGVEHIDVQYILDKNIIFSNTPGQFSAPALGEQAILLMLSLSRKLKSWEGIFNRRGVNEPVGDELYGKRLGLIGLGNSGKALARIAGATGMKIRALDVIEIPKDVVEDLNIESSGTLESLDELLTESDYVSIHCPLTESSKGMIGKRELGLMKKNARLINVARGAIVDEEALLEALKSGQIAGAGLDAYSSEPLDPNHPFLKLDNVIASPHCAGVSFETSKRRAQAVAENISRLARGEIPLHGITKG